MVGDCDWAVLLTLLVALVLVLTLVLVVRFVVATFGALARPDVVAVVSSFVKSVAGEFCVS